MPHTVPNKPTKGAVEPTVANTAKPSCMRLCTVPMARWMLIGLAQATVFGLVAAVKWAVRAPDRAQALDRVARGLGKTFWFGPFKINFYGRSA